MIDEYHKEYARFKSFWEKDIYPEVFDVVIVGAGFTGLHTALSLKERAPQINIVILEAAVRHGSASTRNAGFICFGSPTEIISDLNLMGRENVVSLVKDRYKGIQKLKQRLSSSEVRWNWDGTCEVLERGQSIESNNLSLVNEVINEATGIPDAYQMVDPGVYGLKCDGPVLRSKNEGAMHPGLAVRVLENLCLQKGMTIIHQCAVQDWCKDDSRIIVDTTIGQFFCEKLVLATNAFFQSSKDTQLVRPAKNQVYVTNSVKHGLKGTYHMNEGYVYFRPVGDRILIGGGRHLESGKDEGVDFNPEIESYLLQVVHDYICPNQDIYFEHQWLGHIGVGPQKMPVVKEIEKNIFIGVRLSGMGVALAPIIGERLTSMIVGKNND